MEVLIVLPLREIAQVLSSAYKSIKEHINLVKHGHQLYVTDAVPIHIDVIAMGFFVWIGYLLIYIAVSDIKPLSSETFLIVIVVRLRCKDGQGYGAIALNLPQMLQ